MKIKIIDNQYIFTSQFSTTPHDLRVLMQIVKKLILQYDSIEKNFSIILIGEHNG